MKTKVVDEKTSLETRKNGHNAPVPPLSLLLTLPISGSDARPERSFFWSSLHSASVEVKLSFNKHIYYHILFIHHSLCIHLNGLRKKNCSLKVILVLLLTEKLKKKKKKKKKQSSKTVKKLFDNKE